MPAVSSKQQRLMGWVYACKTGKTEKCPKRIKKIAKGISTKSAHDFAIKEHLDENQPLTFKKFLEIMYDE